MPGMATLPGGTTDTLDARLRGPLIRPEDERYDDARAVYNGMIDKRPGAVVRCADVADVMAGVSFARDNDVLLAIRGGGHSGAGLGVCDDGIVLDLSGLNGVRVDPERRTARVEGGATWGKFDHATHAFGLATPSGVLSTTGVGGLTLGGGHGYLSRRYGLTIDNLLSADVVLADGRLVTASEEQHPDLFWAIRGGGGNFGVVTAFELALHPVANVIGGPMFWSIERTAEVLRWYRTLMEDVRRDFYGFFAIMQVPPTPPFPESVQGRKVCGIVWCYSGPADEAERAFAPVRAFENPIFEHVDVMPYPALQSAFDVFYPPGLQWYWKGQFVRELTDAAIDEHVAFGRRLPTALSTMHLYPIDGAVQDVAPDATAFHHRDARWSQVIVGVDAEPGNGDRLAGWARDYWQATKRNEKAGGYVNFLMEGDDEALRGTYGPNFDRLRRVKRDYDPDNLFRVNHNVPPA